MSQRLPPVWLMGLMANLPSGVFSAVMLMTVPQLLAAQHVPETTVAAITATGLVPTFGGFLLAPILDWRFSRRTYAVLFLLLAAGLEFAALAAIDHPGLLTLMLFAASLAINLNNSAVGGWQGSLVPEEKKGTLGAWYSASNIGFFGLGAVVAIPLLRHLPFVLGAGILSLILLLPLAIYTVQPVQPADDRLAHESFARFFRDLAVLLSRREVLWTLLLFVLPAASFALTNTLGGLGNDYGASEELVSVLGGAGTTVAGLIGSLVVPLLIRKISPRPLYLAIGASGAIFTLSLTAIPPTPAAFGLAMVGLNLFQSAAFAVEYTINLRALGENNPFAATQFGLINAASSLPITYMQVVDGEAYGAGGLTTLFLVDGGSALAATAVLAIVFSLRSRWSIKSPRHRFDDAGLQDSARP